MKTNQFNFLKILQIGFCSSLLVTMVACDGQTETVEDNNEIVGVEEDAGVMDNWDSNRFNTTFASNNRFSDWDANDDDLLDENEFYTSYYDTWDVNNDNSLDEDEWNNASRDYGLQSQNWADWDANGDGALDENEFRTGMAANNYYTDWDTDNDNLLNEREYTDGIFGSWDDDKDGSLTNDDYNTRYNRYYNNNM